MWGDKAMPHPTFGSILCKRLGEVGEELSFACEHLAKDRERVLQKEIQSLQSEIAELRSGQRTGEKILSSVDAPLKPSVLVDAPLQPSKGNLPLSLPAYHSPDGLEEAIAPALRQSVSKHTGHPHDVKDANGSVKDENGPFTLLHELRAEEVKLRHSGSIEAGLGDEELEKADMGYTSRQEKTIPVAADTCVIDPASTIRLIWDLLGIPILSWDLITIPMQVFDGLKAVQLLFEIADWVTLLYWSLDIPFTFFTGFYDRDAKVVMNFGPIARNYFRGPFLLDICIILSDWATALIELFSAADAPDVLSNIAILRILRISRFARLVRLRKLKRKMQTIEDSVNNEWYLILFTLVTKVFAILVVNHYICCGWYMLGKATWTAERSFRWLTVYPYPTSEGIGLSGTKLIDADFGYVYLTSLHWAIAQFTPGPQNIQPQNAWERLYTVFVLLFGMVVFSSFIAAVTQARMQMTKMMSKFERDFWLLRKFCRQHGISQVLQQRMKRYIDFVVVPAQAKLSEGDCVLIQKLSSDLREQLKAEIAGRCLCVHPLFEHLKQANQSVMNEICTLAIDTMPFARGDVAFVGGQAARFMLVVVDGFLDYIPLARAQEEVEVCKGTWISEAVFWTNWIHQGQLQASIESKAMTVDSKKFRMALLRNKLAMNVVRQYGSMFVNKLNESWREKGLIPSDIDQMWVEGATITRNAISFDGATPLREGSDLSVMSKLDGGVIKNL